MSRPPSPRRGPNMEGRALAQGRKPKPRVCLVMIVRDESAIIEERLRAVLPEIDGFVVLDTGSVDRTQEIVTEVLGHLPGTTAFVEWAGFAAARTEALRIASLDFEGWWALLLDADTIFHAAKGWRSILERPAGASVEVDVISCEVHHGSIRYSHPRLLKLGAQEWRWRGVLHEYLEIPVAARPASTELIHVEHGSGGARSRDPEKFRKDALLLAEARDQILRDTSDPGHPDQDLLPRYTFYEAQSLRDAGYPEAAEAVYEARAGMGGFDQEVYLSWLNVGELRLAAGEPQGAVWAWLSAHAADDSRAEALVGLAGVMRDAELWAPAFHFGWQAFKVAGTSGGMFADVNVRWAADFEVSVAAWYVKAFPEGRRACERVLLSELAPESVKERTRANLELYP